MDNTETLELPSLPQVHTRGPVDVPWYNPHYSQRPPPSDRLPDLHLPQSYASPSFGANSHRAAADSSSNSRSAQYSVPPDNSSSYTANHPETGLKTPTPSPTSQKLTVQSHGLAEERADLPAYSSGRQGAPTYTQAAEPAFSNMNQPPQYMDSHQSHIPSSQSYAPQQPSSNGMSQYPPYQQPTQVLHSGSGAYAPSPTGYPQYGYANSVSSPQGPGQQGSASMGHMNPGLPSLPSESTGCN